MKALNKYLFLALAGSLFALTSCEDSVEREPSPVTDPNTQGAYFPETNQYSYEFEPEAAQELTLTIARENTEAATTVPVEVLVNTDNVFQIPESVSFEAGQAEAPLHITFPDAEIGITYNYELKFGEGAYDPYMDKPTYAAGDVIRIKWNPFDEAVYMEGLVFGFFTFQGFGWPYGVYVNAEYADFPDGSKRVRIINPYTPGYDVDSHGIYSGIPYLDTSNMVSNDVKLQIDINGSEASIPQTFLGFDMGYGEFITGNVYPTYASDKNAYPLGKATSDDEGNLLSIVFGPNSLFGCMLDDGRIYPLANPTGFFFSVEEYEKYLQENVEE